ncbi:MAG: hypothetical protein K0B37_00330 [Bacteroidales bacterium]|nr:hypothetical protein [Bacteroidales bacterium]
MKQFSTLENDLTMILELLAEMVDTRHLTQKQMMHIMENYFNRPQEDHKALLPDNQVVKNIMNYSHSLEVMKTPGKQAISVIAN